jgi:hypothetical protein
MYGVVPVMRDDAGWSAAQVGVQGRHEIHTLALHIIQQPAMRQPTCTVQVEPRRAKEGSRNVALLKLPTHWVV